MEEKTTTDDLPEEVIGEGDLTQGDEFQNEQEKQVPLPDMTKDQLIEKISEVQALADHNLDSYLRSQAEMENMKKTVPERQAGTDQVRKRNPYQTTASRCGQPGKSPCPR